jgi:hypothetical protein
MKVLMHALAASCEELCARTGNPPLDKMLQVEAGSAAHPGKCTHRLLEKYKSFNKFHSEIFFVNGKVGPISFRSLIFSFPYAYVLTLHEENQFTVRKFTFYNMKQISKIIQKL